MMILSPEEPCGNPIQKRLDESMPWVGRYILAASSICTLAMAADAFNGFRLKKLWFPCKYFSLDATSLTLLAVAMKLPMDLTTIMIFGSADFAKFSSTIFMSTAIGNFMTSLGSMNDKDLLPNVIALAILVFTIVVDVAIQLILLWPNIFYVISATLVLLCLATLFSLAATVPTAKRSLELKYQEKHKVALGEEDAAEKREGFRIDDERGYMMKYWVMAATSNPQFVMARSVASTTPAFLCLLAAALLALVISGVSMDPGESPYGESTSWILYVQTAGVAIGSIAPLFRCFLAVRFKCSSSSCWKKGFKIETYWIQTLVDWRDSFSPLHIRQGKYRKCLHNAKWFALTFCVGIQILFVLLSKLLLFFSVLFVRPFFSWKFKKQKQQEQSTKDLNLSNYVLLLEDEPELPRTILNNICREADKMIQTGKKKQPENLVHLLSKFVNFNGVGQFDSTKVKSLHGSSKEPPYCWTLPLVTLTSIALAIPNTTEQEGERLLSRVSEGLSLAKLVDKTRDTKNSQLAANIRKAADICWVGVVLYMQWQEIDLRGMSHKFKDSKKVLEELCNKAEGIFKDEAKGAAVEDPLYWPARAVAANSMYRITRTILLSYEEEDAQTDEEMFERLCVMIADILAACLTNLPHLISTMCHSSVIEEREKSVGEAFLLLGKTEQIVQLLQKQEWPFLDHDHNKAASIEEWRALFRQNEDEEDHPSLPATPSKQTLVSTTSGKYLSIQVSS